MSSGRTFCVPILNNMMHSNETRKILEPYRKQRKQSEFIRDAILDFALKFGFMHGMNPILENKKPEYISDNIWLKILVAHEKTHYIRYGYVITFYWLLSLPEFENYSKSQLMREIILLSR